MNILTYASAPKISDANCNLLAFPSKTLNSD